MTRNKQQTENQCSLTETQQQQQKQQSSRGHPNLSSNMDKFSSTTQSETQISVSQLHHFLSIRALPLSTGMLYLFVCFPWRIVMSSLTANKTKTATREIESSNPVWKMQWVNTVCISATCAASLSCRSHSVTDRFLCPTVQVSSFRVCVCQINTARASICRLRVRVAPDP